MSTFFCKEFNSCLHVLDHFINCFTHLRREMGRRLIFQHSRSTNIGDPWRFRTSLDDGHTRHDRRIDDWLTWRHWTLDGRGLHRLLFDHSSHRCLTRNRTRNRTHDTTQNWPRSYSTRTKQLRLLRQTLMTLKTYSESERSSHTCIEKTIKTLKTESNDDRMTIES